MKLTNAYENRLDVLHWLMALGLVWAMLMVAMRAPQPLPNAGRMAQSSQCVRFSGACRGPTASCCKAMEVGLGNIGER